LPKSFEQNTIWQDFSEHLRLRFHQFQYKYLSKFKRLDRLFMEITRCPLIRVSKTIFSMKTLFDCHTLFRMVVTWNCETPHAARTSRREFDDWHTGSTAFFHAVCTFLKRSPARAALFLTVNHISNINSPRSMLQIKFNHPRPVWEFETKAFFSRTFITKPTVYFGRRIGTLRF